MNDLTPVIEQARLFITQNVPQQWLDRTFLIPLVFLVAGVGLSVLGAKLAKPAFTTLFGLLGAYGGAEFARAAGVAWPLGLAVGALMAGTIGFLTFRMWVGATTAVILTAISLGAFSYENVAPYVPEFQRVSTGTPASGDAEFSIPTPAQQESYRDRTPTEWAKGLWGFVTERDESVRENGKLVTAGTLAAGLFLGVVAMRWMLILSTSLLGTFLILSAVMTFLANRMQDAYQAFQSQSQLIGMAVGGVMVTSLIVQVLLTRKAPSEKKTAAKS